MKQSQTIADVCLITERTYPYLTGDVSDWTHELIKSQKHLTFYIVAISSPDTVLEKKFELPSNVIGVQDIITQKLPKGKASIPNEPVFFEQLEKALLDFHQNASQHTMRHLIDCIKPYENCIGQKLLFNSPQAWNLLLKMYQTTMDQDCCLDYFWSWRGLYGSLLSILLAPLPQARIYHALCTGYAGAYLSKAAITTGKPCLITEHGIYANERRIEIASADWIKNASTSSCNLHKSRKCLRDFWIATFMAYSKICYELCDKVITLYTGNTYLQKEDGADPGKIMVIANGVDSRHLSAFKRLPKREQPTISLIERIVPNKDIKSFIRACAILRSSIPNLKAYIAGPTDEDPHYFEECLEIVQQLGMEKTIEFTGKVKIRDCLLKTDILVLTSLNEAQPISILEAGAAGIPCVATNVGACSELLQGAPFEDPPIGPSGAIAQLADPQDIAQKILSLLENPEFYLNCSLNAVERTKRYYNKERQEQAYRRLYESYLPSLMVN